MRNLSKQFVIAAAITVGSLSAGAATITQGIFTYTTSGTNASISKVTNPTGEIVIPSTITDGTTTYNVIELKANIFKNATNVTAVTIPATITKWGSSVFEGCTKLSQVTFEEGFAMKSLGSYSFKNCTSLEQITLPEGMTSISINMFTGSGLTSFVVPNTVTMLQTPFTDCKNLKSLTLGNKITSFASSCVTGSPIEEIKVSEGNTSLKAVDGVLYDTNVKKLQYYPAAKKDEVFTLPATVTSMSDRFNGVLYLKKFISSNKLTSVMTQSFINCPELESVQLGYSVYTFGSRCFTNCPKFTTLTIDAENEDIKCVDDVVMSYDGSEIYSRLPIAKATKYVVPETVTTIYDYAFNANTKLVEVVIPESVETIDESAFAGCTALETVTLPKGLKEISYGLFSGCKALSSITLPDGLTSIGEAAFKNCNSLTEINIPTGVTAIEADTFYGTGFTKIVVPDGVKTIGEAAWYGTEDVTDIVIGSGVTKIGDEAFASYADTPPTVILNALEPPTISSGYYAPFNENTTIFVPKQSLEKYLASENYNQYKILAQVDATVQTVTLEEAGTLSEKIPADLVNGVQGATISGKMNGDDFTYLNTMTQIKDLDLSKVSIVAGGKGEIVTEANVLPKSSVKELTKLETFKLPENLVALADSSLCSNDASWFDTKLTELNIPASVKSIGAHALENRAGLTELILPEGLTYLGANALSYCEGLKKLEIPAGVDTIREYALSGLKNLTELKLNEGLKALEYGAVQRAISLESIVIPNSVDSIGSAFIGCKALKNVKLSENLHTLAIYSFWMCESLEEIELPNTIKYIGQSAFSSCTKLRKINLPESLTQLRSSAFSLDESLERIDIPRYVTEIGSNTFFKCSSLKLATVAYDREVPGEEPLSEVDSARLPKKVSSQNSGIFNNCTSLEAIYIGPTITFMSQDFLANTPSLKKIYVANTTPPDTFDGESPFDSYEATLYVPASAIATYKVTKVWKNFKNIVAIEGDYSGVADMFDDPSENTVTVVNGKLVFSNPSARVSVITAAGHTVYTGAAAEVEVTPGLYIISINGKGCKILVK